MREILFRAKRLNNGEWVYGSYVNQYGAHEIYLPDGVASEHGFSRCHVIPEAVCQYTGLTDKNGRKIFEGDIVNFYNGDGEYSPYEVRWRNSGFSVLMNGKPNLFDELDDFFSERCEVIGNIYDNPELLGVRDEIL